jgi:uncharacterized protein
MLDALRHPSSSFRLHPSSFILPFMHYRRIIVDGYSLLHRDPRLKRMLGTSLPLARQQLVRLLERSAGHLADRLTLVFDGQTAGTDEALAFAGFDLVFSEAGASADSVIERMVHEDAAPAGLLVVTSDLHERRTVAAAGADTMGCGDFLERCRSAQHEVRRRSGAGPARPFRRTLGDVLPGDSE